MMHDSVATSLGKQIKSYLEIKGYKVVYSHETTNSHVEIDIGTKTAEIIVDEMITQIKKHIDEKITFKWHIQFDVNANTAQIQWSIEI